MCGIAGVAALRAGLEPIGLEALGRMAEAMHHRGPDERGAYRDARAGNIRSDDTWSSPVISWNWSS